MGCRLCEVYCITQHSKSKDIIKAYRGEEPRPVSGIYFEEKGSVSFALQCRHCEDAPCLEACITGAMYRDEGTGMVLHNYSRPLISYYLGGRVSEDRMAFRDASFYERNEVDLVLGRKAEELDVEGRKVVLSDGTSLKYEKLLLATGGRPIIPPIDGLGKVREGAFTFTRLSDAKGMLKYIEENEVKEAVVLGAGS